MSYILLLIKLIVFFLGSTSTIQMLFNFVYVIEFLKRDYPNSKAFYFKIYFDEQSEFSIIVNFCLSVFSWALLHVWCKYLSFTVAP